MAEKAQGTPTKAFFVGMLTRDIELSDAILDLLDNCLDGVVRSKKGENKHGVSDYYKGYYAHIRIESKKFTIEDNCGGIPRTIAEKYAFRMGRTPGKENDDLPTVGIYGIGMKRAIFKIGKSAVVTTCNDKKKYSVLIPSSWTSSEDDWDFPITDIPDDLSSIEGTKVEITDINESIANKWNTKDQLDGFVDSLIKSIQQSYSFIIQKGFEIKINNKNVEALSVNLLVSDKDSGKSIKPFLYKQTFDDVHVSLAIGFYAPPPSQDELDDEATMKRTSPDAGWTIVCNDRVVLYNDKTHLTGWGEAGVPHYHTQFIGIRGIVIFESNNPQNLPMTTTKRGIDTSSAIYSAVKDRMRQGLKLFTDYTNRWKGQNEQERTYSTATKTVSIGELVSSQNDVEKNVAVKFKNNKNGLVFSPDLPKPAVDKPYKRISYNKSLDEIEDIIEYWYEDRNHSIKPSQVGEKCFDIVLQEAKNKKGE